MMNKEDYPLKHLSYKQANYVHLLTDIQKIEAMNLLTDIAIMHLSTPDQDNISDTLINAGLMFLATPKPTQKVVHKLIYEHVKFLKDLLEAEGAEAVRDDWTDWYIVLRDMRDDIAYLYAKDILYREYGVTADEVQKLYDRKG